MPLVIKNTGRGACPTVVCDECGQEIKNAREGNYQWDLREGGVMYFTHKKCCHRFEAKRGGRGGGRLFGAADLDLLLVYLRNNLKVDMKCAGEKVVLMASIG
jgi:hypothetical protein